MLSWSCLSISISWRSLRSRDEHQLYHVRPAFLSFLSWNLHKSQKYHCFNSLHIRNYNRDHSIRFYHDMQKQLSRIRRILRFKHELSRTSRNSRLVLPFLLQLLIHTLHSFSSHPIHRCHRTLYKNLNNIIR